MKKEITVATLIDASIAAVWGCYTTPADIVHWNNASGDWHTPRAENNLREGGRFNYRMESTDGKEGFDFGGVYTRVIPYTLIEYMMDDDRKASVRFSSSRDGIAVTVVFEPENVYPEEMQREGWQAILDNFRKYVGSKRDGAKPQPVRPCLWFDDRAEEAVAFYRSVFNDSETGEILYYGNAGREIHGHDAGSVMTIDFRINDQWLTALNGGPDFKFNEALSLQVLCETQAELDYYWEKLTEGGEEVVCGWLKDKFGVSWQVEPRILNELLKDPSRAERVMEAYLKMKKVDIDTLLKA